MFNYKSTTMSSVTMPLFQSDTRAHKNPRLQALPVQYRKHVMIDTTLILLLHK